MNRTLPLLLILALCGLLNAAPPARAADASPSPAPSASAPAPAPSPASVVGARDQFDTYTISAGQEEGYLAGDHVVVNRAGKKLGEGVIFSVAMHTAVLSFTGNATLKRGDQVIFMHHKVALTGAAAQEYVPKVMRYGEGKHGAPLEISLVSGKYNFIYFYYNGHPKCEEIYPAFKKWLERAEGEPDAEIILVDVGFQSSPLAQKYEAISLPHLKVTNRSLRLIKIFNGHSTLEVFKDPNFMKSIRQGDQ
jgi:hypothetical protein